METTSANAGMHATEFERRATERPSVPVIDTTLDVPPEAQFDHVVALATLMLGQPISALMLRDRHGKWYQASSGSDVTYAGHGIAFSRRAMRDDTAFVVLDAHADARFADLKQSENVSRIRFGAGATLRGPDGNEAGAMCLVSPEPRNEFSELDHAKLASVATIVYLGVELNRHVRRARNAAADQIRALREANARIKDSFQYATLLSELQATEMPTDKLAVIALAAWRQNSESAGVLGISLKLLRERMTASDYKDMIKMMPGFSV